MSIDFAARSAARRASHDATTAPRWRPKHNELTHFAITERQGPDPDEEPSGPVNRCRLCAAEGVGMILHPDPESGDCRRQICGTCQGAANARRAGISPREGDQR